MTNEDTEWNEIAVEDLQNLSEGDMLRISYESVYAETTQTLEAKVDSVNVQVSRTEDMSWFDLLLDLGDREEQLRERKKRTERDCDHIRKLDGCVTGSDAWVGLYARNGGRWHNISEGESIEVRRRSA